MFAFRVEHLRMIRSSLFLWLNQMILTATLLTPFRTCKVVSFKLIFHYFFWSYYSIFATLNMHLICTLILQMLLYCNMYSKKCLSWWQCVLTCFLCISTSTVDKNILNCICMYFVDIVHLINIVWQVPFVVYLSVGAVSNDVYNRTKTVSITILPSASCMYNVVYHINGFPVAGPKIWNALPEDVTSGFSRSLFQTSSSDTDCILTFSLGLSVPILRWFCCLRTTIWYDMIWRN